MLDFIVLRKYPAERKFAIRKAYSRSVIDDFLRIFANLKLGKPASLQSVPKAKPPSQ